MAIYIATSGDRLDYVHENIYRLPPATCLWSQEDMENGTLFDHGIHYHNTHICGVDGS